MLEILEQPAFLAKDQTVTWCNPAFAALRKEPNQPISRFLFPAEPARDGAEPLACLLDGREYEVRSTPIGEERLYILRSGESNITGRSLELMAASLRQTTQQVFATVELLDRKLPPDTPEVSSLLRSVFRMERAAEHLDRLQKLLSGSYLLRCERVNLYAEAADLLDRARPLMESAGIRLEADVPKASFPGSVDRKLLALALWTLLEAAVITGGETVRLTAERPAMSLFRIRVESTVQRSPHEPCLPEYLFDSIGKNVTDSVDMQLVQAIAKLHDGNLVMTTAENGALQAVMSFRTNRPGVTKVRTDVIVLGRTMDEGLVGLADILPRSLFDSRDILG